MRITPPLMRNRPLLVSLIIPNRFKIKFIPRCLCLWMCGDGGGEWLSFEWEMRLRLLFEWPYFSRFVFSILTILTRRWNWEMSTISENGERAWLMRAFFLICIGWEVGRRDLLDLVLKKSKNLHTCKFSPATRKLIISLSRPPCSIAEPKLWGNQFPEHEKNTKKKKKLLGTVMSCSILIRYDTLSLLLWPGQGWGEAERDLLDPQHPEVISHRYFWLKSYLNPWKKRKKPVAWYYSIRFGPVSFKTCCVKFDSFF